MHTITVGADHDNMSQKTGWRDQKEMQSNPRKKTAKNTKNNHKITKNNMIAFFQSGSPIHSGRAGGLFICLCLGSLCLIICPWIKLLVTKIMWMRETFIFHCCEYKLNK